MLPRFAVPRLDFSKTENLLPVKNEKTEEMSQLDYIRRFISDRLVFPNDPTTYAFTHADLEKIKFIGAGRFGHVSEMRHKRTGNVMAVKRIRLLTNRNDEAETNRTLQRLRIEVEAIKKASSCDEIVQFYGVTFHEGDCWVCMELLDANLELVYTAVHQLLHTNYFDETVLGAIAISTIKALDHLKNEMQLIHRDVKPSNILLDLRGRIKLCDFGISGYLVDSIAETIDAGCRPYMAPERLRLTSSNKGYDIRSDVWSLGITMVEVATGKFPFPDFLNVPLFTQLQMVVHGDPPLLTDSQYSPRTINFVNSCLIKEVSRRPTFAQLMDTEYYHHYSALEDLQQCVAEYVQMALKAKEQLT